MSGYASRRERTQHWACRRPGDQRHTTHRSPEPIDLNGSADGGRKRAGTLCGVRETSRRRRASGAGATVGGGGSMRRPRVRSGRSVLLLVGRASRCRFVGCASTAPWSAGTAGATPPSRRRAGSARSTRVLITSAACAWVGRRRVGAAERRVGCCRAASSPRSAPACTTPVDCSPTGRRAVGVRTPPGRPNRRKAHSPRSPPATR